MRRLLLVADILGLTAAFFIARVLTTSAEGVVAGRWEIALFLASLPVWVVLARLEGLYDRDEERTNHSTVDDFFGVFTTATIGTWMLLLLTSTTSLAHPTLRRLVLFWILTIMIVTIVRAVMRSIGRRQAAYLQRVIVVGSGPVARLLGEKIDKHPEYGLRLVGFVDHDGGASSNGQGPLDLLGTTGAIRELVQAHAVDRVVVAFSTDSHEETLNVIRSMQDLRVQVDIVPRMFEVLGTNAQLHTIQGIPLVGLPAARLSGSSMFLKRWFDLLGAALGLVLLAPFLTVVAICIKLDSRGPVFFRQVRMGEGEREFRIFKFRTMIEDAEQQKVQVAHLNMHKSSDPRMFKVPNDPRVTRVGAFLRRWRVDEMPQLVNVLKGEMSLVGPRPLILDEDVHVTRWARRRLSLKPGMTGLWQVLGASEIPFDEMTKLDYLYVTNWSLGEDIRLILLTLQAVVRPRSAY